MELELNIEIRQIGSEENKKKKNLQYALASINQTG
jgi:hypothetical protein